MILITLEIIFSTNILCTFFSLQKSHGMKTDVLSFRDGTCINTLVHNWSIKIIAFVGYHKYLMKRCPQFDWLWKHSILLIVLWSTNFALCFAYIKCFCPLGQIIVKSSKLHKRCWQGMSESINYRLYKWLLLLL